MLGDGRELHGWRLFDFMQLIAGESQVGSGCRPGKIEQPNEFWEIAAVYYLLVFGM